MKSESLPFWVALAGNPNTGKSALFNALTGGSQKVANYPGVTVERKIGSLKTEKGRVLQIVDLPGTYSLDAHSIDESVTRDFVFNKIQNEPEASVFVAVASATSLERNLGLVLEIQALGKPVVLALNMMDLAKYRGFDINLKALEAKLGIPVIPTIAIESGGIDQLIQCLDRIEPIELHKKEVSAPAVAEILSPARVRERYKKIDELLKEVVSGDQRPDTWSRRIDRAVLHPFFGPVMLLAVLFLVFQAVFVAAEPFMGLIESGITAVSEGVKGFLIPSLFQDFVVDGLIAGVGGVVIFLPQILILFAFILILEGSGYMARAAFIMDRLMRSVGLNGRAFIPILSSYACAVPGIMAARTISSPWVRFLTIMILPLTTCSARLPVYALLIGAFIPSTPILGYFGLQGVVLFGLYLMGAMSVVILAWIMTRFSSGQKDDRGSMIMELPAYQRPRLRFIIQGLWVRASIFLKRVGTIILGLSILLWALSSFPKPPEGAEGPAITYSYAGKIGATLEPLVRPIGFDWRIATGLIPGFAAREVMVSALATVFAVESESEDEVAAVLSEKIKTTWPLSTGLALLVWYIFSPQCLSTIAVMKRELGGWKWALANVAGLTALAYIAAFITFQGFQFLGY